MARFDDIGLFWEDLPPEKGQTFRPQPPIPDTGWLPPKEYPDLREEPYISIDVETYDPELKKFGPGWARGVGHLVGVSIMAPKSGFKGYFPIKHEVEPEWNLNEKHVKTWLRQVLSNPKQPKIGANLTYDVGWLRQEGVFVKGMLYDVQVAEALLNEYARVSLEDLGMKYCGEGKESNELYRWCDNYYGGGNSPVQRKNIYRAPPRLVGFYAESDVDLPIKIFNKQVKLLKEENLWDLFLMESKLLYLVIEMRFAGVTVDIEETEKLRDLFIKEIEQTKKNVLKETGIPLNVNNGDGSLVDIFNHYGIPIRKTEKGNPSFSKEILTQIDHPFVDLLLKVRKREKFVSTFLESYILDSHIDGKVYGQFKPLLGESGGTRSGRFSSATPNLQNIPARDKVWAPKIRGLFIPDKGHRQWRQFDYSQIEYRMFAHYAVGDGSVGIRERYSEDPRTDYHETVRHQIKRITGLELERKPTKTINFGMLYGMGKDTLSKSLGLSKTETNKLFDAYHAGVPFAKTTMQEVMEEAQYYGLIHTILGRKARFDLWEPSGWGKHGHALTYEKARRVYGSQIKRAGLHKALNRKLQGSAADLMKKAMVDCYEQGIFASTGIPRLTVHDELDFSDSGSAEANEAFKEMRHVMETAIKIKVPILVDEERGVSWGRVEPV